MRTAAWTVVFVIACTTSMRAQFQAGSKSVDGSVTWSQLYYDGRDMGTVVIVTPSFLYFVFDHWAATGSVSVTAFRYDRQWLVDEANLGLGAKYVHEVDFGGVYAGAAMNFNPWPRSFLAQGGLLVGLGKTVYADFGLNYSSRMGDNKISTVTLGVGIIAFF